MSKTWWKSKAPRNEIVFFSFVLAFSTFIKRTKIFVFHSSFIRKNGKKCPMLREKSFCFSKSFFPTLKEKSFCLAKAFFLWQKDFSFRVGKKFLPKLKILWFGEKSNEIFSWNEVQNHLGYFSKKLNICWKYSKLFQSIIYKKARQMKKTFCFNNCACYCLWKN